MWAVEVIAAFVSVIEDEFVFEEEDDVDHYYEHTTLIILNIFESMKFLGSANTFDVGRTSNQNIFNYDSGCRDHHHRNHHWHLPIQFQNDQFNSRHEKKTS